MIKLCASSLLLALIGPCFATDLLFAQDSKPAEAKTHQILIEYVAPKDKDLVSIYEIVKQYRTLELFQEYLSPLRLPAPLLLKFKECDGESNAWYEDNVVTTCYEYIAENFKNAPRRQPLGGVTRQDAMLGPAVEVVLHEVGHAVFDMLDIPSFGREEDAADQFAAFILINLGKEEARRTINGIAFMYRRDAKDEVKAVKRQSKSMKAFADEHGLAAQRFYNILCLAYGAYPDVFQYVLGEQYLHLPKERARRCAHEYKRLVRAFDALIVPHMDPALLAEVSRRRWLPPVWGTPGAPRDLPVVPASGTRRMSNPRTR